VDPLAVCVYGADEALPLSVTRSILLYQSCKHSFNGEFLQEITCHCMPEMYQNMFDGQSLSGPSGELIRSTDTLTTMRGLLLREREGNEMEEMMMGDRMGGEWMGCRLYRGGEQRRKRETERRRGNSSLIYFVTN